MAQIQPITDKQRRTPAWNSRNIDWSRFLARPLFTPSSPDGDSLVSGKTILITGAGGSIGSSLAFLLMGGLARKLIFLDHSEQNLRQLYRTYRERNVTLPQVEFLRADVRCRASLEKTFGKYRPQVVFHVAALKHLPPLESDPFPALETNLAGTWRLLEAADCWPVECFVNVSTDKAVIPTSILGASKRLAELLLLAIDSPIPRRLSLRLGNVLNSSGSVVPLFLKALQKGQPLEITHREASRYFLTLEEAAAFLLRCVEIRQSSLLLPEMGPQRKITALADFLLQEVGYPPLNHAGNFLGLRDGEKCCEQLIFHHEYLQETAVKGLYKICGNRISDCERFVDDLGKLLQLVSNHQAAGLIEMLIKLVPEFTPSPTLLRHVC